MTDKYNGWLEYLVHQKYFVLLVPGLIVIIEQSLLSSLQTYGVMQVNTNNNYTQLDKIDASPRNFNHPSFISQFDVFGLNLCKYLIKINSSKEICDIVIL